MQGRFLECCRKSIQIALIVGTVLTLVNQGHLIAGHRLVLQDFIRIGFNFLIPLFVSTYSRLALLKEMESEKKTV